MKITPDIYRRAYRHAIRETRQNGIETFGTANHSWVHQCIRELRHDLKNELYHNGQGAFFGPRLTVDEAVWWMNNP